MVHRFIIHLKIIYVFVHGCKLKDRSMTRENFELQNARIPGGRKS
jgi:hypothetical protein